MKRLASIIFFSIVLSGCLEIPVPFLPAHAKVNQAFPPNAEIRAAADRLRAIIRHDPAALASFEERYTSQLAARAQACTSDLSIGRFDSAATVKTLLISRDCLNTQDGKLLQQLGVQQIATLFSQAPLPAHDFPSSQENGEIQLFSGDPDSGSLAVTLQGKRGEFTSLEIPEGQIISSPPTSTTRSLNIYRSPNGRVTAIQAGDGMLTFVDTQSGVKLWESGNSHPLLAWMPEISAAWIGDKENGGMSLADFQTGRTERLEFGSYHPMWVLPLKGAPTRALAGWGKEFTLLGVERSGEGIKISYLNEFLIPQAFGEISRPPFLMLGGKTLVFVTSREFISYDLASRKGTSWLMNGLVASRHGKLGEATILIDAHDPGGTNAGAWVFDIEQSMLLPVNSRETRLEILAGLSRESGIIRLEKMAMFGILETGNNLRNAIDIQKELILDATARIQAANALTGRIPAPAPAFLPAPAPAAPAPAAAAPVRQFTSGGTRIADMARNARIEAVGVYRGTQSFEAASAAPGSSLVKVRIRDTTTPVFLVLSACTPVRWSLQAAPGAKLSAVVLFGAGNSEVTGINAMRINAVGDVCAFQGDGPRYDALNRETVRVTGKSIDYFQGRYEGESFTIGE